MQVKRKFDCKNKELEILKAVKSNYMQSLDSKVKFAYDLIPVSVA